MLVSASRLAIGAFCLRLLPQLRILYYFKIGSSAASPTCYDKVSFELGSRRVTPAAYRFVHDLVRDIIVVSS